MIVELLSRKVFWRSFIYFALLGLCMMTLGADPASASEAANNTVSYSTDLDGGLQAFEMENYEQSGRIAAGVLSTSQDAQEIIDAEDLLIQSIFWSAGGDAAIQKAEELLANAEKARPAAKEEQERLKAAMIMLRGTQSVYQSELAHQQSVQRRYAKTELSADALLRIAKLMHVYRPMPECVATYDRVIKEYPLTAPAVSAYISLQRIKNPVWHEDMSAASVSGTESQMNRLDVGIDALGAGRIQDAITIARGLLSSGNAEIRRGAIFLLLNAIREQSGYDAAVGQAWKLAQPSIGRKPSPSDLDAVAQAIDSMCQVHLAFSKQASEEAQIISLQPSTDQAADAALRIARLTRAHGTMQDVTAAYERLKKDFPATPQSFAGIMDLEKTQTRIGFGKTVVIVDNKVDADRLEKGMDAQGAFRTRDAIVSAKALLVSRDQEVRHGAISLLLHATREQSGYDAALALAWTLAQGTTSNRPQLSDLQTIYDMVAEMGKIEKDARRSISKCNQIISYYPGSDQAAKALVEVARLTYIYGGIDEAIPAFQRVVAKYPRSERSASALLALAGIYGICGEKEKARQTWISVIRTAPDSGLAQKAILRLARPYQEGKSFAQGAQAVLSISRELPRTSASAWAMLTAANLLRNGGDAVGSERIMLTLLRTQPQSMAAREAGSVLVNIYFAQGASCLEKGDAVGTSAAWKKAYAIDTDELRRASDLYRNCAMLVDKSMYREAHALLKVLRSGSSAVSFEWRERAECLDAIAYYQAGNTRMALPMLRKVASDSTQSDLRNIALELCREIESRDGTK